MSNFRFLAFNFYLIHATFEVCSWGNLLHLLSNFIAFGSSPVFAANLSHSFFIVNNFKLGCPGEDDHKKNSLIVCKRLLLNTYATLFGILFSASFCYTIVMVVVISCGFINKVLGYTIAGLVLNEDVVRIM